MKQFYVLTMNGFSEEEGQELLANALHDVEWGQGQFVQLYHLSEKGVANLQEHVLKQGTSEW